MINDCWTCANRDTFDELICGTCNEEWGADGQPLNRTHWRKRTEQNPNAVHVNGKTPDKTPPQGESTCNSGLGFVGRWVSVKKRLPEINRPVLMRVTCYNHFNIEEGSYKGRYWMNCWCSLYDKSTYPITHWMDLPEAPEET